MPPKEKGKKKTIDGVDVADFTREQLEEFTYKLKEQYDREREERNYFQMEKDKMRAFWEITKTDLGECRVQLKNRERQIEEAQLKNVEELKCYRQKVKFLEYEHQNNLVESKVDIVQALKQAGDEYDAVETDLLQTKANLKKELRTIQQNNEGELAALKICNVEEISKAKKEFEVRAKEMEGKYEKKVVDLENHLTYKYEMEISEVEERKNEHISILIQHHEKSFNELKNHYNDVTLNNLSLISALKYEIANLKKQKDKMTKHIAELHAEIKRLEIPLKAKREEINEFKRKLQNYDRDKMTLNNTKMLLVKKNKDFRKLRESYGTLEHAFDTLEVEKDDLHDKFINGVIKVDELTNVKNVHLMKRIEALTQVADRRDSLITEIRTEGFEPAPGTSKKIEIILHKKNKIIKDLQFEVARVCKAHDDILESFESKLVQFGIPKSELGFMPLKMIPEGQGGLAIGPGGLVTKNR